MLITVKTHDHILKKRVHGRHFLKTEIEDIGSVTMLCSVFFVFFLTWLYLSFELNVQLHK